MSFKIWCNAELPDRAMSRLKYDVKPHEVVIADSRGNNLSVHGFSKEMEGADVAFGQPHPQQVIDSPCLRYVQITSAGYTHYDTDPFKARVKEGGLTFCNSSSVYNEPCAQHILAFMLAQARQIPAAIAEQSDAHGWIFDRLRPATRVLKGDRVLILGYGAIAKRLIELLAPFNLEIVAARRSPRGDELVPTYPISDISKLLPDAHHVINVLPANDSTRGLIDGTRFSRMMPGAIFYNVGRGTTVDQDALIEALTRGSLAAAYLDVTDPEPLPADSPLWTAPNCVITPHIAGGFQDESLALVDHFVANFKRFEAGVPMIDEVF